jgi:hypothetical protein
MVGARLLIGRVGLEADPWPTAAARQDLSPPWTQCLILLFTGLVASCAISLPFPGGGLGYATVVQNMSAEPFVVQASDDSETRYYAVPPQAGVVVDTVGEANPPVTTIAVLDSTCTLVKRFDLDFSSGGTITISAGRGMDFTSNRQQSADEQAGAKASCEETF